MSISGVRPRDILTHLKNRDPTNVSSLKTIYNARSRLRLQETCGRTHMQQLMKLIYEHGYIERHRAEADVEVVSDIFFTHPTSIQLIKAFPLVFMMDCTYKTNRYRMPLLEIVGVTSTGKTFAAAFMYLHGEKEDNYTWAMECFNSLFDGSPSPKVIITDHELGLMKAVATVFPMTINFLCRVHIWKNVVKNCRKAFSDVDTWNAFMGSFADVMRSNSERTFFKNLQLLDDGYHAYPNVISYLHGTWFDKHRERFVTAWIDRHMHLGNTSTNRVESHHAKLKRQLQTSMHNFVGSWQTIHNLLELHISEVRASFEESLTRIPHRFRGHLYQDLVGVVSIYALHKLEIEISASDGVGPDSDICDHSLHTTCGLPCAHMIAEYKREGCPIPISAVHPFWRKLGITPFNENFTDEIDFAPEIELLLKRFNDGNAVQQKEIKRSLQKLTDPSATLLLEPTASVNTRGRKKGGKNRSKALAEKSTKRSPSGFEYVMQSAENSNHVAHVGPTQSLRAQYYQRDKRVKMVMQKSKILHNRSVGSGAVYMSEFSSFLPPFINNVYDVIGDVHCGFHVVAMFLGMSNEGWREVSNDLLLEIEEHPEEYQLLFYGLDHVEEVKRSLRCQSSYAHRENWMTMPEMGFVIASCYKVIVVHISKNQCLTFFPLRDPPPPISVHRILGLGFVKGCHFVGLDFTPDAPLPPAALSWIRYRLDQASGWV
ncbi:hypothetical protein QJS04_geneDACA016887 [Acorus gramineus]|uniref:MULE transposase domain-containing protein n=1 Tax=Acorus gramineus TaxID=55184 RepID=A0AAV9BQS5_ACOGR|nr:hypothetical protein QJS04_geneDACA016887 [Acorus gramineus]